VHLPVPLHERSRLGAGSGVAASLANQTLTYGSGLVHIQRQAWRSPQERRRGPVQLRGRAFTLAQFNPTPSPIRGWGLSTSGPLAGRAVPPRGCRSSEGAANGSLGPLGADPEDRYPTYSVRRWG
jgi:hypothetical protein